MVGIALALSSCSRISFCYIQNTFDQAVKARFYFNKESPIIIDENETEHSPARLSYTYGLPRIVNRLHNKCTETLEADFESEDFVEFSFEPESTVFIGMGSYYRIPFYCDKIELEHPSGELIELSYGDLSKMQRGEHRRDRWCFWYTIE